MSSRRNFRNPIHRLEVVNVTRFAPWPPLGRAGLAGASVSSVPKIPKKFHQIAQNKREKIVKKIIFEKIYRPWSPPSAGPPAVTKFLVVNFYLDNLKDWFYGVAMPYPIYEDNLKDWFYGAAMPYPL
jgi:hypothetical protein